MRAPAALLTAAVLAAVCGSLWWDAALPAVVAADAPPWVFSEARTLQHVDALCARGPRATGSAAEAAAFEARARFALRSLPLAHLRYFCVLADARARAQYAAARFAAAAAAADASGRGTRIEVDVRRRSGGVRYTGGPGAAGSATPTAVPPPGALWSDALYSNLTLLVARVTPRAWDEAADADAAASFGLGAPPPPAALLLSVHVDTQWTTEGASDNTIHVASLLELLSAVAAGAPPASPLIFLLQSGEEDGMLGAHAFATSHPWAADVAGFVNLEAMGGGGRAALFQATRGASWMLSALAGLRGGAGLATSALAADAFAAGMVNSDTDLRIFRDYGKRP
jgi:hypothetical protein